MKQIQDLVERKHCFLYTIGVLSGLLHSSKLFADNLKQEYGEDSIRALEVATRQVHAKIYDNMDAECDLEKLEKE